MPAELTLDAPGNSIGRHSIVHMNLAVLDPRILGLSICHIGNFECYQHFGGDQIKLILKGSVPTRGLSSIGVLQLRSAG